MATVKRKRIPCRWSNFHVSVSFQFRIFRCSFVFVFWNFFVSVFVFVNEFIIFPLNGYFCFRFRYVNNTVTEVHWRIIANLGFKFRSHFIAHCCRRRPPAAVLLAVLLAGASSRAMLASARSLVSFPILSFFVVPNLARILRLNHRTDFYSVCFI